MELACKSDRGGVRRPQRRASSGAQADGPPRIERLGVVGAGQMGRGIAQVAAPHGIEVTAGRRAARRRRARARRASASSSAGWSTRASSTAGRARGAVLARIETDRPVRGDLEASTSSSRRRPRASTTKREIFRALDRGCRGGVVLATNTSSISITGDRRRGDAARARHRHALHEPAAADEAGARSSGAWPPPTRPTPTTRALAERLGKTTVVSRDIPGFIVNRVLIPLLNEACFALYEGIGTGGGHRCGRQLGPQPPDGAVRAHGPHRARHGLAILEVLHRELGDRSTGPARCCASTSRPGGWGARPGAVSTRTVGGAQGAGGGLASVGEPTR